MESVIEANKEGYYRALRQTQTTLGNPLPQWYPWILFFLHALTRQKDNLLDRLAAERTALATPTPLTQNAPPDGHLLGFKAHHLRM